MTDEDEIIIQNLVMLCCLIYPRATAMRLHTSWIRHTVLSDYERPSYSELQLWVREIKHEA